MGVELRLRDNRVWELRPPNRWRAVPRASVYLSSVLLLMCLFWRFFSFLMRAIAAPLAGKKDSDFYYS